MIKKKTTSKVTSTVIPEEMKKVTSTEDVKVCTDCKVEKLTTTFPNEDLNKLVEKINEIVEKLCR